MASPPRRPISNRSRSRDRGRSTEEQSPESTAAEDWLWRFREGDREAFDHLVEEFHPRLVQFFHRLCWDLGRAEDLTQTLFLKLLRGSARYRPEGKLATYVFRIATNLWIDHYRSSRPGRRMFSLDQAMQSGHEPSTLGASGIARSEQVAPDQAASDSEEKQRLREALERLTEPHRLVFELAVYQQLPYSEIGAVLDIPVGTVKSRMHNSVKALRENLGSDDDSGGGENTQTTFRAVRGGTDSAVG